MPPACEPRGRIAQAQPNDRYGSHPGRAGKSLPREGGARRSILILSPILLEILLNVRVAAQEGLDFSRAALVFPGFPRAAYECSASCIDRSPGAGRAGSPTWSACHTLLTGFATQLLDSSRYSDHPVLLDNKKLDTDGALTRVAISTIGQGPPLDFLPLAEDAAADSRPCHGRRRGGGHLPPSRAGLACVPMPAM